jgi:hypothetical protein
LTWRDLEVGIAEQGDFLVLLLDLGRGALEVEAGLDFLAGFSTAFLTSTMSASQTTSNDGIVCSFFYMVMDNDIVTDDTAAGVRALVSHYNQRANFGPSHASTAHRTRHLAPAVQYLRHSRARAALPARARSRPIAALAADPVLAALPRLVLGGGSNLLITARRGRFARAAHGADGQGDRRRNADAVLVRARAGENWHGFVQWTLDQGLGGLENMSLIPGTVGASPIQNIGAYGAEVKDTFHR